MNLPGHTDPSAGQQWDGGKAGLRPQTHTSLVQVQAGDLSSRVFCFL